LVSALKVFLTHGLRQHHDADDDDDDDAAMAHELKRLLEHLAMKIKILTECQKVGHFAQCPLGVKQCAFVPCCPAVTLV